MKYFVWLFSIVYFAINVFVSWNHLYDTFDGYLFLNQAKRLLNFETFPYAFESSRPRFGVAILYIFYKLRALLFSGVSEIRSVHIWMIAVNAFCFPIWFYTFRRIVSDRKAFLLTLTLGLFYQFWFFSYYAVADILCVTLWGIFFWVHFSFKRNEKLRWTLYGIIGGLIALTKFPHFFFFPCFLLVEGFLQGRKKIFQQTHSIFAFILTIELFQRILGDISEGFWFYLRVYVQYLFVLPGFSHKTPSYLPPTSQWTYVTDVLYGFGLPLFILICLCLAIFVRERKTIWEAFTLKEKSFFISSFLMTLWHQIISHKEPRYVLPMIPALLLFCGLVFWKSKTVAPIRPWLKSWRGHLVMAFLLTLPLLQSAKVTWSNYQPPPAEEAAQLKSLTDWIATHSCQSYYVCSRRLLGIKMDHVFLSYKFPHQTFYEAYCSGEELGNAERIAKHLIQKTQDEPGPGICLLYGKSFFEPPELPPLEKYEWDVSSKSFKASVN